MKDTETTPSVAERSTEFVAVEGGENTSDAGTLLVVAYVLMWAIVFGFIWQGLRKQRLLNQKVEELMSDIQKTIE